MKRLKVNFALLALLLGTSAAIAAKPHVKPASTLYGYNQSSGLWELTRSGSHCITNPNQNCEAQWNGDPNNGGTIVPGTETKGNFVY
jgi:hypothetical protein